MKWSEEAWNAAGPVYESIKELPFVKELAAGTLGMDRFLFYINQDRQYLDTYSRVLAHIASRMTDNEDMMEFLRFSTDGVAVEKSLHAGYSDEVRQGKTLACAFYTAFLKSMCEEHLAVEAAAVLPCFRVYQKVGEYILSIANMENNPYAEWIATYGSEDFDISTRKATEICDKLAEEASERVRQEMTKAYVDCTKLEWLFWDNAYRKELF